MPYADLFGRKIDGPYMGNPACASSQEKYGKLRGYYGCNATLYK